MEDAQWQDEVVWRTIARLTICSRSSASNSRPIRSTCLRCPACDRALRVSQGAWCADGKRIDEVRPFEAVGRNQRFEAIVVPEPHPRRVG